MAEQDIPNGNGAHREERSGYDPATFGEEMQEAQDFFRRQWRENPLQVAAAVAGLGLVLGLLLGRRR